MLHLRANAPYTCSNMVQSNPLVWLASVELQIQVIRVSARFGIKRYRIKLGISASKGHKVNVAVSI